MEVEKRHPVLHVAEYFIEGHGGHHTGKDEAVPQFAGEVREIIVGGREIFNAFKFRHRLEASIHFKTASVITATDLVVGTVVFNENISAMRADIGKAIQCIVFIARKYNGLVQETRQQGVRRKLPA